jgi:triphosphatase
MHEETELKLRIPEGAAGSLGRNPVLSALKQRRGFRRKLLTVYYDTPSLSLAKRGVSLRVRHMGDRKLQGVKLADGDGGGTWVRRPESETEIDGDRPEIARISDPELRKLVTDAAGAEPLAPAFVSEFGRTVWPVKLADSEIEVALDQGEIRTGDDRAVAVSELELELKSGRPDRLIELALALGRSLPLSVERHSKAQRGFALLTGRADGAVRASPVELDPDASAADAFRALARNCLSQLGANEAAVRGGDADGIHQMRVAARRLRALLACFRDLIAPAVAEELKGELRWLMGALGAARDLDVFIAGTLDPIAERGPEDEAFPALCAAARRAGQHAREAARIAISSPRYTQSLLRLDLLLASGAWAADEAPVTAPVRPLAQHMLRSRCRQLMKIGRGHEALQVEELHQIRIAAKKMRYAAEFFRSLYRGKPSRRYLTHLIKLQDRLGALNDAVTGRRLLEELLPSTGLDPAAAGRVMGLVLGWQAARIHAELPAFPAEWEAFRDLRPFWSRR